MRSELPQSKAYFRIGPWRRVCDGAHRQFVMKNRESEVRSRRSLMRLYFYYLVDSGTGRN
jgi:hypothetical protein